MSNQEMINPSAQIYDKIDDKTDLSLYDGTMYMRYLENNNINIDKENKFNKVGFIWKPQHLVSDVLKKNNIKYILHGIEQKLGLQDYDFKIMQYIDPQSVLENPTKMSYLIIKAAKYIKMIEETDDNDTKKALIDDLIGELNGFDLSIFKEFIVPTNTNVQKNDIQEQTKNDSNVIISNTNETAEIIKQVDTTTLQQSDQVRKNIYNTWDKNRLIEYILLLENTNTKLEQQTKQIENQFQEYKVSMQPILAKQQHLLKVPDIIRNEFKQQKLFGLW